MIHGRDISDSTDTIIIQSTNRLQIHENGNLFISNVQESDTGSYRCTRSNEAGSVAGLAFLGVLGMYIKKTVFIGHNLHS